MTSLMLLCILMGGQQPLSEVAGPGPAAITSQVLDYELGPGDLLSIQVSGVRTFDQRTRVSNSGRIRVPYVGIMLVAGMTAVDVEREISRLIKEHELVNEPAVRVQIESHNSRPAYVIGEVNAPGQYIITGELYLLDLISKAGGVLPSAAPEAVLYRRSSFRPAVQTRIVVQGEVDPDRPRTPPAARPAAPEPNGNGSADGVSEEVIPIDLKDLREGVKPELNMPLRGGDILYVPRARAQNIYVIGDVKVPGAYTLPRRGEITAAQAVIYAGGPMNTAKQGKGFLMRHNEAGVREAMAVDFKAIIEGRQPDIPVHANDIIFIPNSAVRTIGVSMLALLPLMLQQFLIF